MTSCTSAWMAVAAIAVASPSFARAAEPPRSACLSREETRQAMQAHRLVPPVRAVDAALRMNPGEAVGIKLCHAEAVMVYDVAVLRRDGRLVHVHIDAGSGSLVPAHTAQ